MEEAPSRLSSSSSELGGSPTTSVSSAATVDLWKFVSNSSVRVFRTTSSMEESMESRPGVPPPLLRTGPADVVAP